MGLFDLEQTDFHPAYLNIRCSDHPSDNCAKELCEDLWNIYKPFADNDFRTEFPKDFYSRFWEMDLTCRLLGHGLDIQPNKEGPDICINHNEGRIWIEAVCPKNGEGENAVPEHTYSGEAYCVPDEHIILRYTSAIASKNSAYHRYTENEKIIKEDEPFVIALNGCQIPDSRADYDPPRVVRLSYGIGNEYVTIAKGTGEVVNTGFHTRIAIPNPNQTEISTKIFYDPEYQGVSAILFSASDCINRREPSDFVLVHNCNAKNPLPYGLIREGTEWIPDLSEDGYVSFNPIDHNNSA